MGSFVACCWRLSPRRPAGDQLVVFWHWSANLFEARRCLYVVVGAALCVLRPSAFAQPSPFCVTTSSSFCERILVVSSWRSDM